MRKAITIALIALASLAAFANRGNGGAVRGAAARAGMMGGRFTEVQYLQSTGTQYIDTGYSLSSNNAQFQVSVYNTVNRMDYLIGSAKADGSATFLIGMPNNWGNAWVCQAIGSWSIINYKSFTDRLNNNNIVSLSYNGSSYSFSVTGSSASTGSRTASIVSGSSIYLFAVNRGGTMYWGESNSNPKIINYAKIYDNGILVRDFVPVRDTAGNGYMLDKVTGQLYGNSGTGAFIVGPDK